MNLYMNNRHVLLYMKQIQAALEGGGGVLLKSRGTDVPSRKHAKSPPQKYQNEDEPVPMLALVPIHLRTGTFGVDET